MTSTHRRWTLALALTGACASTPPPVAAPVATPTPVVAEAPVVDAGAPVAAPAPVFSVANPLGASGVIMAEQPGGTVTLHPASGPDLTLADGERVTFVDDNASVGGGNASATVEARGVRGAVPNARVVTEARLGRATSGAAVFSAIFSCGDVCHREVWFIGANGQRARVTQDAGANITVMWRPDGAQVAVGSCGLWVIRAADGHVEAMETFTSPAYAPDGALFARGVQQDDGVFELADGTPPRRVFGAPGRVPPSTESAPAEDPAPVVFEQDGAVLRATFLRAPRRQVTMRAGRDGRPARQPAR